MGKAIEEIALKAGHEIVLKISSDNMAELTARNLQQADVAIEFTNPHNAVNNLKKCLEAGVPVVCGSTGWLEHWEEIKNYCEEKKGALLYASNFSIGVNILFELNRHLARIMSPHNEYSVSIEETHHTEKKDAPSGTAITLAEGILQEIPLIENWVAGPAKNNLQLGILSHRIDPAPGTHLIRYESDIDSIEIKHTAHNRSGFAQGAVAAAIFLKDKQGIFTMKDVLAGSLS